MKDRSERLSRIKALIQQRKYRLRSHAVQHMIKEGFSEKDILGVVSSGQLLESYDEESRCLILGSFEADDSFVSPLHVLCDYSNEELVDIVTAYIPQKPWWHTETRRGRIQ